MNEEAVRHWRQASRDGHLRSKYFDKLLPLQQVRPIVEPQTSYDVVDNPRFVSEMFQNNENFMNDQICENQFLFL